MSRKASLAILAITALVLAAVATASPPKTGYYEADVGGGNLAVTAHVNGNRRFTSFAGPCAPKGAGTGNAFSLSKHFRVVNSAFHYRGKVKLYDTSGTHPVKSRISGRFADHGKKWKGRVAVSSCKPVRFKGTYLGRHPEGKASSPAPAVPRHGCGTLEINDQQWGVASRRTKCVFARRWTRRYLERGRHPRGWKCKGSAAAEAGSCRKETTVPRAPRFDFYVNM